MPQLLLFIVFHFVFPSPKGAVGPVLALACALTNAAAVCKEESPLVTPWLLCAWVKSTSSCSKALSKALGSNKALVSPCREGPCPQGCAALRN